ncbi:30S ribosomal protein S21 [bacterium]|nr:30S ribosomal protein S21 [bacterium]
MEDRIIEEKEIDPKFEFMLRRFVEETSPIIKEFRERQFYKKPSEKKREKIIAKQRKKEARRRRRLRLRFARIKKKKKKNGRN